MSVPHESSGFEDSSEPPRSGELHVSQLELVMLLDGMHKKFDTAEAIEDATRLALGAEVETSGFSTRYIQRETHEVDDQIAETRKITLIPLNKEAHTVEDVDHFTLEFTELPGWTLTEEFPEVDGDIIIRINDVLLTLQTTRGNTFRYLVNKDGVTAVPGLKALDTNLEEVGKAIEALPEEHLRPNIYSTKDGTSWLSPILAPAQVTGLIDGSRVIPPR